jgi:hypothetical protein
VVSGRYATAASPLFSLVDGPRIVQSRHGFVDGRHRVAFALFAAEGMIPARSRVSVVHLHGAGPPA